MLEEIKTKLAEQLGIDADTITEESDITKDLGADSLDLVELLMSMEDETGKTIPEDKIAEIKTIGDLVKVLESL